MAVGESGSSFVGESAPQPASPPTDYGDLTPGGDTVTPTFTTPPRRPPNVPPTDVPGIGPGGIGDEAVIGAPVAVSSASAGGGSTGPISIVLGQDQSSIQSAVVSTGQWLLAAAVVVAALIARKG